MKAKFQNYLNWTFFILLIFYGLAAAFYYLSRTPAGDEQVFLADLNLLREQGWINSIKKNISIPFMLLAYPVSFVTNEVIALRLVNLFLIFFLFFYLYFLDKRKQGSAYLYLLFYISAVGFYYYGTNDALFFISLFIFLNEAYKASNNRSYHLNLALIALIIAIFTRKLFIVYSPVILYGLYFLIKRKAVITREILIPSFLLIFFLVLNIPSLQQNGSFSFDLKSPPKTIDATWTQRQYLSQLQQNQGKRKFLTHPTWQETENYLKENGDSSLPKGNLEAILFNIPLTAKEFVKDLLYVFIYHSRTMSIMLLVVLVYPILNYKKIGQPYYSIFIPVTILMMILIFSLIIISHVELRWLGAIFLLTVIAYNDLEKNNRISNWIRSLNILLLCILTAYGSYGLVLKTFYN